jgi:uncharacterized protein YndB with AHSA1/START domain
MTTTAPVAEDLTLNIAHDIHVRAPIDTTFAALLEELGDGWVNEEGKTLHMKLEARPGGRMYRDLGNDNGHFWGNVQAIKRPTLLEISGPLFMSHPVANNIQYRLSEVDGGTQISFRHTAFGPIPPEARDGMPEGWSQLMDRVQKNAESHAGRPTKK